MAEESEKELKQIWDDGLADDEICFIGKIVAHWGAIEHEIFRQTLQTFDTQESEVAELPKAMNNLSFTKVLELWDERVVAHAEEPRRSVLEKQKDKIESYQDYRNALVHGMWDWERGQPEVVTTTRIRKKEIITTKFNEGDLNDFYTELAQINLYLRYPGGMEDIFKERAEQGFYINEAALRRLARDKNK
jgi:hypothetical protein